MKNNENGACAHFRSWGLLVFGFMLAALLTVLLLNSSQPEDHSRLSRPPSRVLPWNADPLPETAKEVQAPRSAVGPGDLRISGRVIDEATEEPISGALVALVAADDLLLPFEAVSSAKSNEEGRFNIQYLDDGRNHLLVLKDQYVPAVVPRHDDSSIEVHLSAGLSISGRVVDHRGRGLAGAKVAAYGRGCDGPARLRDEWLGVASRQADLQFTTSGPDGEFRMRGFREGPVRLLASLPGWRQTVGENRPPTASTYDLLPLNKPFWTIADAGAANILISMEPVALLPIQVVDSVTGLPIAGATVSHLLDPNGHDDWEMTVLDAEWVRPRVEGRMAHGTYTAAWLPRRDTPTPGPVTIRVQAPGYASQVVEMRPDLGTFATENESSHVVRLPPQGEVVPLGFIVQCGDTVIKDDVAIEIAQEGRGHASGRRVSSPSERGIHEVHLPVGRYRVRVTGTRAFRSLPASPWFGITAEPTPREITVIDLNAGFLHLTIRDDAGLPLPGATIRLGSSVSPLGTLLLRGPGIGLPERATRLHGVDPQAGVLRVLLAAGTYEISAACFGYEGGSAEALIRTGETSNAEIILRSN